MKVLLFAHAAQAHGAPELQLDATPRTVGDLRRMITALAPRLASVLPTCRIAVAHAFADDNEAIPAGAEIAVIPPVSGG